MTQKETYNLGYDNGYGYGSEDRLETQEDVDNVLETCGYCRECFSQSSEFSFICHDINKVRSERRRERLWDEFEEGFTQGFLDGLGISRKEIECNV